MTKKTGNKWKTESCGRCHKQHSNYSGKLDSKGNEYVICENTHKKMIVKNENLTQGESARNIFFHTKWIRG